MQEQNPAPGMTRAHKIHLALIMLGAGLLYLAHSLLRFRNFEAKGYDLGIFDQAVRQYALFKAPIVPIKGVDFNLLGDHFHPILATLAPLYWIWPDPRMLNVALILLLLATVIPVYLFARKHLGHVAGLLFSAALLLWWPFQAIVNWDFHEIAFGVPLVAWIIWAMDARRYRLAFWLSPVLLLIREDLGITIVAIGIVFAFHRQWLRAGLLMLIGITGYLVVTSVLIPMFSPEGTFSYWQFTALGPTAGAAIAFLVSHPLKSFAILFNHELKWLLWIISFVPLALLPFFSPYVIIGAPILLSRLFNDRLNTWGPVYQYDAILAPIFFMAAIQVLAKIIRRTGWNKLRVGFPAYLLTLALICTFFVQSVFPLGRTLTGTNWTMGEYAQAQARAIAMIPDNVCVEAADNSVPHLVSRTYVGLHGDIGNDLSSWMIIDFNASELGGWDPLTPPQAYARAMKLGFTVVSADDHGIWVLHRDIPNSPVCSSYLSR
ncbi:DUF2079 domain-containing protein [Paeniglutamicibacter cryotolerans]|uniref:Putative membrane protein n=1 Tax=Paeniglutamicibacter cryotolerans TaxID=670079 RepID=A0A839QNH5_9MICC|nr:DUF2079 domain-containing protein [Paeniglutamicibacter cryotolerans]MBB2997320.1 putative membrane protein [Paeniglutamicibacter cryotolerans]